MDTTMSSNSRHDSSGQAIRLLTVLGLILTLAAVGIYQQATMTANTHTPGSDAVQRFDRLPMQIDGWFGTTTPIDEKQLRIAEAQASLSRIYTKNGQSVAVLVLHGEPGPLGAHTPEVCYGASGHRQLGQPYRTLVPAGDGTLWTTQFESPGTPPSRIEVTWGWGTDGQWNASESPRVEYAGHARIYKLYVSRRLTTYSSEPVPNAFLVPLLRELQKTLSEPLTQKQ